VLGHACCVMRAEQHVLREEPGHLIGGRDPAGTGRGTASGEGAMREKSWSFAAGVVVMCGGAFLPMGAQEVDRYPSSVLEHLPVLALGAEPELVIGLGDSPDEMFGRLLEARLHPGGGVVVTDRMHPEGTRVFDARGRLLHRIGREGEGPGEVQHSLGLVMEVEDDGSVIFLSRVRQVIRYTPEGELDLHLTLHDLPMNSQVTGFGGRLAGGDLLILARGGWPPGGEGPLMRLDTLQVVRVDPGTGAMEWVDHLPAHGSLQYAFRAGTPGGTRGVPFGQGESWADGGLIVRMDPYEARFEWWDPETGEVVRTVELGFLERPLDDEEREAIARQFAGFPAEGRDDIPGSGIPEFMPLARALLAEITHRPALSGMTRWGDGQISVSALSLRDEYARTGHRLVLSERARPLAWLRWPDSELSGLGARLLDVRGDRALVRLRDETTGVERVEVRRLVLLPPES
jgi:hypothetical protein